MQILLSAVSMWAALAAPAAAVGTLADLSVYDRTENRMLAVYSYDGRHYVAGKPGNEYEIVVRNRQPAAVMAVVAVDGVNVVSGETAHWSQTGYLVGAHAAYGIKGWRKSLQRVARFHFTALENSYAARTGRPDEVGVIGVALFRRRAESARAPDRAPGMRRKAAPSTVRPPATAEATAGDAGPAAGVPAERRMEQNLGTGHGVVEHSPVRYADFERATSTPDEVITVYYDSHANLVARGVIAPARLARPSPFPGRFAPDPQ